MDVVSIGMVFSLSFGLLSLDGALGGLVIGYVTKVVVG
jgi:hypothetical protein